MIREFSHNELNPVYPDVLWTKLREGDISSCEKLFKFYYRDLYGYGLKLSGDTELTRDAIQELFVVLCEQRDNLGEAHSVKAYLLASLRRNILRTLSQKRRRKSQLDKNFEQERIQFSSEELIIRRELDLEQKQRLEEAIKTLPDRQKEVLFLRYYNGMNYREIEEILSINYQSVRNNVYRALEKLRDCFEENLYKAIVSSLFFFLIF